MTFKIIALLSIFSSTALSTPKLKSSETRLPLVLVGTIISADEKASQASIKDSKDGLANVYKQGHRITGIAKVLLIKRDVVLIENLRTKQKEFLRLAPFDPKYKVPKDIFAESKREFQIPRAKLEIALKDISKVLQSAASEPIKRNGDVIGFRITSIDADSVFNDLGIKNGDIIKSANGQPIQSPLDAMNLFMQLRDSSLIEIEIERSEQTVKAQYVIR